MLKQYEVSGLGEIDGYYDDFYHSRVSDLTPVDDERAGEQIRPLEDWLNRGTCPLCNNATFYANGIKGVWHCEVCDRGGGVVALQFLMNPDKYGAVSPADGWDMAARDVLAEQVAYLDAELAQVEKKERNHADLA